MALINDYLYVLDPYYQAVGLLSNQLENACPYYDDEHIEKLKHGFLTLEFTVPAKHPKSILLQENGFILYPDLDGKMELFQIKELIDTSKGDLYCFCENAAVPDLLANIVRPVALPSQTLEQAMNYILQGTGWELGTIEYVGVQDFVFKDYPTSLAALHKIMDQYEAEIEFRADFQGLRLTRKYVNVYRKRGQATGRIFSYGRDLIDVKRTRDTKELITALIGLGKGDSGGDGNILTFQDYTPPTNSKYEKGEDWVGSVEALQRWGKNGKHIMGVYKDESATNPAELYQNTVKELERRSSPKVTYQMSVLLLEGLVGQQCRLGDEILVKDYSFTPELAIRGRITEKKSSKTSVDPQQNQVIVGDV